MGGLELQFQKAFFMTKNPTDLASQPTSPLHTYLVLDIWAVHCYQPIPSYSNLATVWMNAFSSSGSSVQARYLFEIPPDSDPETVAVLFLKKSCFRHLFKTLSSGAPSTMPLSSASHFPLHASSLIFDQGPIILDPHSNRVQNEREMDVQRLILQLDTLLLNARFKDIHLIRKLSVSDAQVTCNPPSRLDPLVAELEARELTQSLHVRATKSPKLSL